MIITKVLLQTYPQFYPVQEIDFEKNEKDNQKQQQSHHKGAQQNHQVNLNSTFPSLIQVLHQFSNDLGQDGQIRHVNLGGQVDVYCLRSESLVASIITTRSSVEMKNGTDEDWEVVGEHWRPKLSEILQKSSTWMTVEPQESDCKDEQAWKLFLSKGFDDVKARLDIFQVIEGELVEFLVDSRGHSH